MNSIADIQLLVARSDWFGASDSEVQRLRWVEPGEFLMGSPADEADSYENEGPQHRVRGRHPRHWKRGPPDCVGPL